MRAGVAHEVGTGEGLCFLEGWIWTFEWIRVTVCDALDATFRICHNAQGLAYLALSHASSSSPLPLHLHPRLLPDIINLLTFILFGIGGFIYLVASISFFFATPTFALIGYILNLCANVAFLVGAILFLMRAIGSSIQELFKKLKSQLADYQQMSVPAIIGTLWTFGALLQLIGNAISIVQLMYIPWIVTSNLGIGVFVAGCVIFVWMEVSRERVDTSGAAKYQRLIQEEEAIL